MCPLSQLLRRTNRLLVLLMMHTRHRHSGTVPFKRMRRHALVNIFVGDLDLTRKLDVVVSEFAYLDVVDTGGFFFFGGAEAKGGDETTDEVEGAEDKARADEGICAAGEGVGKLVADLDPVVVEPAAFDDGVAVQMGYVVTTRELAYTPETSKCVMTYAAKKAVKTLPIKPPTPCTAKMSSASSHRRKYFNFVA
jgi:hypothetical protein